VGPSLAAQAAQVASGQPERVRSTLLCPRSTDCSDKQRWLPFQLDTSILFGKVLFKNAEKTDL